MKMIVLKIAVVVVAVIAVAMVIALFTKDKYSLSREVTINKPRPEVFDFIKLNRNQQSYSKWLSIDPETKISYKGSPDGSPGSILVFESKSSKAGTGEWETRKVVPNERLDFELRFLAPFKFTANGYFLADSISANQTKLRWVYNGGMNWPMNFMLLFMDMDKVVGKDLGESANNLKNVVEKQ